MRLDYNNPVIVLLRKALSCLLILPGRIGSTAVYYAIEKHILREEEHTLSCFFRSFRENAWGSSMAWFLFLFPGAFLIWDFFCLCTRQAGGRAFCVSRSEFC